ncbi:hypothetical protein AC062_0702 [Pasteurellaceae bacterium NI1060]|nr:hypothetical protein AC062_0702 [Pasteurellaceae bacterium NI1060]
MCVLFKLKIYSFQIEKEWCDLYHKVRLNSSLFLFENAQ